LKLSNSFPALPAFFFAAGLFASPAVTAADVPLVVPADTTIPAGPEGDAIRLGRQLMNDTRKLLPRNVGNGLNCSSCHIAGGTQAYASPYVGLTALFPMYNARDGRVISLQTRIDDCFERSMNGHPLAWDSKEMNAMLIYIRWLSTGVPVGSQVAGRGMGQVDASLKPDRAHGATIYAAKCASCHGPQGAGTPDGSGGFVFPPVWGKQSYNMGAGMARTETAAAFIKGKMPMGQPDSLSDQDAIDVADFVAHQPRPVFSAPKAAAAAKH